MTPYDRERETARYYSRLETEGKRRLIQIVVLSVCLTVLFVYALVSAVSASTSACSYTIRSGDTLSKIGAAHDTTWQTLQDLNEMTTLT